MAKIRTIKPQFWEDDKVGRLSYGARLLFLCSFNLADDEGRLRWNDAYLGSQAFMYDEIFPETTRKFCTELEEAGMVAPYKVRGTIYAEIVNFAKHQAISHFTPSKLPAPSAGEPVSPETSGRRTEISGSSTEISERKWNGRGSGTEGKPPSGAPRAPAGASARESAPRTPVAPPAGRLPATTENSPATVGEPIGADDVVAAWIDTQRENGVDPTKRQIGQVAKEAKELLGKSNDPDRVLKAAIDAGVKGYSQVGFELSAMSGRAIPRAIATKPTRDDKVRALWERAKQERAKEEAAKAASNG